MKTKFQTENVGTSQAISTFFILTRPKALDLHAEQKRSHLIAEHLKRGLDRSAGGWCRSKPRGS